MKTPALFILLFNFTLAQSQIPTWQWAKRCASTSDNNGINGNEAFNDVKVDKAGNIYAVGNFFMNTAFHNAQLFGQPTPLGYGGDDAYLMKYNSCGSLLWYRRMGGGNFDGATSLVIDKSGNVVVTGYSFSGPSVYSGGSNTITITSQNSNGPQFIAKFDTSGTLLSVHTYPYDYTEKILLNTQGSYIITNGLFAAVINTLGAVTSTMAFITPTPFYPGIIGISLDKNDNIYLTGAFINTIIINPGTTLIPAPSTLIPNTYAGNSLIMKFDVNGSLQYYQRSYWNSLDQLLGSTLDTSETSIIVGARNWNNASVFGYTLSSGVGNYVNPIYRLNALTGNPVSVVTGSTNGAGWMAPTYTDRDNNIHCSGRINSYLTFNTTTVTVAGAGNFQNLIGKLDATGSFVSMDLLPQTGSNPGRDWIFGLTVSEQGNVYVAGQFAGTLDSAGTAVNILGGQEDGFVAKFGFPCGSTLTTLSPLAPTSLSASYQGTLTNLVTWIDNSNYETGFELWYNGPTPTFSLLGTLAPNTTTYSHPGLSYSTTYCYAVRAMNNVGQSAFTNTDCATTPAQTAPQAPTNLTALNTGTLVNNVTWVDNSFDETGFELHYTISPSATYSLLATLPANTTTYTHAGLNYTTTYCYKALATNSIGPSAFTNTDCATTPQQPAPNAPTSLAAANTGSLFNNVNWVDNSNDETGFELWYHDASPTFSLLATLPANTTIYTHTGLSYTTTYCYRANAVNAGGKSAFTNTDCATTPEEFVDETGLTKYGDNSTFQVYPNPASGHVFLEFTGTGENITIVVNDAIGRVVKKEIITAVGPSIHKLSLPGSKGLYFVQVKEGGNTWSKKVVME